MKEEVEQFHKKIVNGFAKHIPRKYLVNEEEKDNISPVPDFEAEQLPRMCEIKFDCLVTMFETGYKNQKGFSIIPETPQKPQWFKIQNKLTLESIRYADEYTIGRRIKHMLEQLDKHIDQYEK